MPTDGNHTETTWAGTEAALEAAIEKIAKLMAERSSSDRDS